MNDEVKYVVEVTPELTVTVTGRALAVATHLSFIEAHRRHEPSQCPERGTAEIIAVAEWLTNKQAVIDRIDNFIGQRHSGVFGVSVSATEITLSGHQDAGNRRL